MGAGLKAGEISCAPQMAEAHGRGESVCANQNVDYSSFYQQLWHRKFLES